MNVPVPPFVKLPTPLITPLYVVELLSLLPPVVNAADNVTFPAPAKDPIVCAKLFKFKMAPLETDISLPFPKLFAIPACNVPALTVVAPVYVFALDKVRMPDPACVNEPLPLIRLPIEILSVRLNCNAALLVTLFVPNDPLVLPAPTCNVPALMVVIPLYVLLPDKMNVPVPPFVKLPTPLITPLYVVELLLLLPPVVNVADNVTFPAPAKDPTVCAKLFKFKMAPLATETSLPLPKLFAIPACNVPALTAVAPVYVFALDKVRMPDPACVNEPLPLMRLPIEILSVRLNCNAALSVTLFVPNDPLVLPAPTCNMPALMVVIPP